MDGDVSDEERAYWIAEEQSRSLEVEASKSRGDAPHLLAGAKLRVREAKDRLAKMRARRAMDG